MQHASIVSFLSGTLSPEALACEISDEVAAFRVQLKATRNGRIIISDGPDFIVTKEGAKRLLEALLKETISFDMANYIADCITLSDHFEFADDATREAIFFLEDDSGRFITDDDHWHPTSQATMAVLALLT